LESESESPEVSSAAALTSTVLDEESARIEEQSKQVLFADDLLPGVNSEELTLKEGFTKGGGPTMFLVLTLLNSLDELEGRALSLMAPEIGETFNISDGTIAFITALSGGFLVLGAAIMGWMADRFNRVRIVTFATMFYGIAVFLTGLTVNAFTLVLARLGVGVAKANTIPVHGSLIADSYPIGVRGRMAAVQNTLGRFFGWLGLVGVWIIAGQTTGTEGWRWVFYLGGIPVFLAGILCVVLREPPRGQFEKEDVLGVLIEDDEPPPIATEYAFERLRRINMMRITLVAISAIGFALFTVPALRNLHAEERFGFDSETRAFYEVWSTGIMVLLLVFLLPWVGKRFDRLYRTNPPRAVATVGLLLIPNAFLLPIMYFWAGATAFYSLDILVSLLNTMAFAMIGPMVNAFVPYRLRGLGTALITLYLFFVGGLLGGLMQSFITNASEPRWSVVILGVPAFLIGGIVLANGAFFIKHDLSLITDELLEEKAEADRRAADPDNVPILQMANVDFSYGPVQVLFDVNFEVREGETLALLGTNGAGKSTVLRVISGLGTADRGVVRLDGRNITFTAAEQRAQMGIIQLPGGKATFPALSVRDNLMAGGWLLRGEPGLLESRIDSVLETFPALTSRLDVAAGDLSGGQQQMLALAKSLLHEPRILLIDELSLGLAPAVVQELLEVIEALKEKGQTMVIVEQSVNLALSISDRAIFMEKGQVRFEGPAQELAERDDLVRAVFFGGEGG
jgi:ABC-type branched-subunit amino acid transport system ATPase component